MNFLGKFKIKITMKFIKKKNEFLQKFQMKFNEFN